jgi:hypothetical protein
MIPVPSGVRVGIPAGHTDMRCLSQERLELGEDLLDGIEIQGTPPASTRSECFTQPVYRERWVCPILA